MRINRDPCWHHRRCSLLLAPRSPCTPPRRRCSSSAAAAPEHEALLPHRAWVRQGSARRSCPQGTHPGKERGAGCWWQECAADAGGSGMWDREQRLSSGLGAARRRGPAGCCGARSARRRPRAAAAGCPRRSSAPCRRSLISVPSCPRRVFLAVVLITFRAPE